MVLSISSDFYDKLASGRSEVNHTLYIGNSNYSDRVIKWPTIKKTVNKIKSADVSIALANNDRSLNTFYIDTYNSNKDIELKIGVDTFEAVYSDTCQSDLTASWNTTLFPCSLFFDTDHYIMKDVSSISTAASALLYDNANGFINISSDRHVGLWRVQADVKLSDNHVGGGQVYFGGRTYSGSGTYETFAYDIKPILNNSQYVTAIYDFVCSYHINGNSSFYGFDLRSPNNIDSSYIQFKNFKVAPKWNRASVYKGSLKNVTYKDEQCIIKAKDRLWEFTEKVVGTSEIPASFNVQIPTDIMWTLCTCYGGLVNSKDAANADIDYTSFQALAAVYSGDTVDMQANFDGQKVIEALTEVASMSGASIWINNNGKVEFKRLFATTSANLRISQSELIDFEIDTTQLSLINNQSLFFNYSVNSKYWQNTLTSVNTESENNFGKFENIIKSDKCWYTTSAYASLIAERNILLYSNPPVTFNITTGLNGVIVEPADAVSLVNSFYGIGSDSYYTISDHNIDMQAGHVNLVLYGTLGLAAFYLDKDSLDSTSKFLL